MPEAKMCTAVTTYNNISGQLTEAKMTMHIRRFRNWCMTVTTDDNISSYLTEAEMTVHVGFLNLCTAYASMYIFFHFSYL